jgi:hypothetical protein
MDLIIIIIIIIIKVPENVTDNETLRYTKLFFLTNSYSEDDPLEF